MFTNTEYVSETKYNFTLDKKISKMLFYNKRYCILCNYTV